MFQRALAYVQRNAALRVLLLLLRLSDARNEDFKDFNFSVCTARDMSEQEYELVELAESEQEAAEGVSTRGNEGGASSYPARGRGGAMRGRARTGFRGGRGKRGAGN